MSDDFIKLKEELSKQHRRTKFKIKHIMIKDRDFLGFTALEIWGDFQDFNYEEWLKEHS